MKRLFALFFCFPALSITAANYINQAWPQNNASGISSFALTPQSGDVSLTIYTNQPAGTRYFLAPGVYNCYYPMQVPTNGAIVGSGPNATLLVNWVTNNIPLFIWSDGGTLANLTVSNVYTVAPGNAGITYPQQAQFCWGVVSGTSPANNVFNINLFGIGETDVEFVDNTVGCSWQDISCTLTSHWDTVALKNGPHMADYRFCTITPRTNAYATAGNRGSCFNNQSFTGRVRVFNSSLSVIDSDAYYIRLAVGAIGYEFYNCSMTNFGNGFQVLSGTRLTMDTASSRSLSPLLIIEDLGSESKVDYGSNIVRSVTFGGSSDDGIGPMLYADFPTSRRVFMTNGAFVPKNYLHVTNITAVASGYTPDCSKSFETVTTNDAMVFGLAANLPANEYFEHIIILSNTVAADKPIIFPLPYTTNIAGNVMRLTNRTKITLSGTAGRYTNALCQPQQ